MKRIAYLSAAVIALSVTACSKKDDSAAMDADVNMAMTDDMATSNNMAMSNDMMAGNAMGATADKTFLTDAMKSDNAEIANGNLAASMGSSAAVKDFGRMLVTDHGAHKAKVAAMITSTGGTATDDTPAEAKAMMTKLKGMSGTAFDKAFKDAMIADHNKDIAMNEKQAMSSDAATAQLAKDTLPVLKKHLAAAKAL